MASTAFTRAEGGPETRLAASWRPIAHATGYPTFTALMQRDELAGADTRRMLTAVLTGWGLRELREDTHLVATELVTNAVQHGCGDVIRVNVARTGMRRVRVSVTDRSRRQPHLQQVDLLEESGRGLALVQAVASSVGVIPLPWGKSVWAEVTA
ncbi:ATP-binding protein [Streptomyces thermocarboxydovorans]|uniref:ATP-binding protein n=1 Tax=Streptomyces thermocarboxydovorans TaxID=59298 RepID=A0ABN1HCY6_9ACTN